METTTQADATSAGGKLEKKTPIDPGVSQACLSNLVIFTEELEDLDKINQTVSAFVVKHPCRVILILAQPRAPESRLEAESTPRTFTSASGKRAIYEQITLRASGASVRELAGALQPLLVPDLPIYVWWRGVFLHQRALVEQVLTFADRFIYDGANWTNLHFTVLQIADLMERYSQTVGFTNFNWSRLRPWRENTAGFFDVGMFDKDIWDIQRVRVEYMALPGSEEGFEYRALLFVAWMAAQLEWTPVRGTPGAQRAHLEFTSKKGAPVDAELILLPQTTPTAQSIQRVLIETIHEGKKLELSIERDHKDHLEILTAQSQTNRSVLRKVPHADSSLADLLYRELGRRGRNRIFEKSFKLAANLLQLI
jgi:glucose-6-phosphate dehydrogenase assembly protein OpcA